MKLTIGYSVDEGRLFITVHSCRSLSLAIEYSLTCSTGAVTHCHSCTRRALASCSKDGPDSYVSFILLPDRKANTKRRTSTKKRDLNPEFNERLTQTNDVAVALPRGRLLQRRCLSAYRFDFDLSLEESTQRRLELSVKNSVSFMSRERELIGKVAIARAHAIILSLTNPLIDFVFLNLSCNLIWTKSMSGLVSHNGNN